MGKGFSGEVAYIVGVTAVFIVVLGLFALQNQQEELSQDFAIINQQAYIAYQDLVDFAENSDIGDSLSITIENDDVISADRIFLDNEQQSLDLFIQGTSCVGENELLKLVDGLAICCGQCDSDVQIGFDDRVMCSRGSNHWVACDDFSSSRLDRVAVECTDVSEQITVSFDGDSIRTTNADAQWGSHLIFDIGLSTQPGEYTVTSACNGGRSASFTISQPSFGGGGGGGGSSPPPEVPNAPPIARFTTDASIGFVPLTATFDASTSSDEDGSLVAYTWLMTPNNTLTGESVQFTFVDEGVYPVQLTVTDEDGATSSTTKNVIVAPANSPPVLSRIGNKQVDVDTTLSFDLIVSDPEGDAFVCDAGILPEGATFVNCSFSWTPVAGDEGNYDVTFTVTDNGTFAQSASEEITITVGDGNRPPELDPIADVFEQENMLITIPVTYSDPDSSVVVCAVSGDVAQSATFENGTCTFSWTPSFEESGVYTLLFTVTDDGDPVESDSQEVIITVGNVNRPPVLQNIPDVVAAIGDNITVPLTWTEPDGDLVACSVTAMPENATFDEVNCVFSWIPNTSGQFDVTFTVTDDGVPAATDSQVVSITVNMSNNAPVIDPIADTQFREGEFKSFTLTVSDPNPQDTHTWSASNVPDGAVFDPDTQVFSWTPRADQAGEYIGVTFTVIDSGVPALSDTRSINLQVGDVNRAPSIEVPGPYTVDENDELVLLVLSTDPDGDDTFCTAGGLPDGALFDDTLCEFRWTPDFADAGQYDITFTVTDDGDPSASAELVIRITVGNVNRAPVIENLGQIDFIEGQLQEYTFVITEPDNQGYECSAQGLPQGSSLDPQTCVFSWFPSFDATGNYQFELTVTDDNVPSASTTATIFVNIGDVNRPPTFVDVADYTFNEGDSILLNFVYSDLDGDQVLCSSSVLPEGAGLSQTQNACTFSWTPGYTDAGVYDITFTVTDVRPDSLSTSETMRLTIENANTPPVALFTATPDNGVEPLEVSFDASQSFDVETSVVSYEWDFENDGVFDATGINAFHTYTTSRQGGYVALLRVTDTEGLQDTFTRTIVVINNMGENDADSCEDGLDNDNDGLIDYPVDPGCASPSSDEDALATTFDPVWSYMWGGLKDDNGQDYPYQRTYVWFTYSFSDDAVSTGQSLFDRLSVYPENHKVLHYHSWLMRNHDDATPRSDGPGFIYGDWFGFHPLDKCIDPVDATLTEYSCPFFENGQAYLYDNTIQSVTDFYALGGDIDHIMIDYESAGYPVWNGRPLESFTAIVNDPRFVQPHPGLKQRSPLQTFCDYNNDLCVSVDQDLEATKAKIIDKSFRRQNGVHYVWNAVMNKFRGYYLEKVINDTFGVYDTDGFSFSNWEYFQHNAEVPAYDPNGHPVHIYPGLVVGTHQAPTFYGKLFSSTNWRNTDRFEVGDAYRTPFHSLLSDIGNIRTGIIGFSEPLAPWINWIGEDVNERKDSRYYEEGVFHLLLHNPDYIHYWWNPSIADREDLLRYPSAMQEVRDIVGYTPRSFLLDEGIALTSDYALTGIRSGNRHVWRFTPEDMSGTNDVMQSHVLRAANNEVILYTNQKVITFADAVLWRPDLYTNIPEYNYTFGVWVVQPLGAEDPTIVDNPGYIVGAPECADNFDNDGDGLIDLGDNDCADGSDDSESGQVGIELSGCADGLDNDADGLIDLFDPGCRDLSDSEDMDERFCAARGGTAIENDILCNIHVTRNFAPSGEIVRQFGMHRDIANIPSFAIGASSQYNGNDPTDPLAGANFAGFAANSEGFIRSRLQADVGSLDTFTGTWIVDIEYPLLPSEYDHFVLPDGSFAPEIDLFIEGYKRRIDVLRQEMHPDATLMLYGHTSASGGNSRPGQAGWENMKLVFDYFSDQGMYDNVDYAGPLLYHRFGLDDDDFNYLYMSQQASHLIDMAADHVHRTDGTTLPIIPILSTRVYNGGSNNNGQLIDISLVQRHFDAIAANGKATKMVYWHNDESGVFDTFFYDIGRAGLVPEYCKCPSCSDGLDSDGDNWIDADDSDCSSDGSYNPLLDESRFALTACSDGLDNDGDGLVDSADESCLSADHDSEIYSISNPECSDGIDNDADGLADFPLDPGCDSFLDDSESGEQRGIGASNFAFNVFDSADTFKEGALEFIDWTAPDDTTLRVQWNERDQYAGLGSPKTAYMNYMYRGTNAEGTSYSVSWDNGEDISYVGGNDRNRVLLEERDRFATIIADDLGHLYAYNDVRFVEDTIYVTTTVSNERSVGGLVTLQVFMPHLTMQHDDGTNPISRIMTVAGGKYDSPFDSPDPSAGAQYPRNLGSFAPLAVLYNDDFTVGVQSLVNFGARESVRHNQWEAEIYAPSHRSEYILDVPANGERIITTAYTFADSGNWQASLAAYKEWIWSQMDSDQFGSRIQDPTGPTPSYCPIGALSFFNTRNSGEFDRNTIPRRFDVGSTWETVSATDRSCTGVRCFENRGVYHRGAWPTGVDSEGTILPIGQRLEFNPRADLLDPHLDVASDASLFQDWNTFIASTGARGSTMLRPCSYIENADVIINDDGTYSFTQGTIRDVDLTLVEHRDDYLDVMDYLVRSGFHAFYVDDASCNGDAAFLFYAQQHFADRYGVALEYYKEGMSDRQSLLWPQIGLLGTHGFDHSYFNFWLFPQATYIEGYFGGDRQGDPAVANYDPEWDWNNYPDDGIPGVGRGVLHLENYLNLGYVGFIGSSDRLTEEEVCRQAEMSYQNTLALYNLYGVDAGCPAPLPVTCRSLI